MKSETDTFLAAAWEAANAVAAVILDSWQQPREIAYKGTIDLVTSVDRLSEQRIVEVLQRRFPDHSILAEEETDLVSGRSQSPLDHRSVGWDDELCP